jgi:hypothetical protein
MIVHLSDFLTKNETMNILYIVAILVQLGVIIFFIRRSRKLKKESFQKEETAKESAYEQLRGMAIRVTCQQLELAIPQSTTMVYGVVMDWNLNESVMTLATYITGAANLYLSTGEGINGGGKDPEVGESAVDFVMAAQQYISRAMPVTATDLPPKGCIRFYLLTNKGLYAAQEPMTHFEDASSPWLSLFELGSGVIAGIRKKKNGASVVH